MLLVKTETAAPLKKGGKKMKGGKSKKRLNPQSDQVWGGIRDKNTDEWVELNGIPIMQAYTLLKPYEDMHYGAGWDFGDAGLEDGNIAVSRRSFSGKQAVKKFIAFCEKLGAGSTTASELAVKRKSKRKSKGNYSSLARLASQLDQVQEIIERARWQVASEDLTKMFAKLEPTVQKLWTLAGECEAQLDDIENKAYEDSLDDDSGFGMGSGKHSKKSKMARRSKNGKKKSRSYSSQEDPYAPTEEEVAANPELAAKGKSKTLNRRLIGKKVEVYDENDKLLTKGKITKSIGPNLLEVDGTMYEVRHPRDIEDGNPVKMMGARNSDEATEEAKAYKPRRRVVKFKRLKPQDIRKRKQRLRVTKRKRKMYGKKYRRKFGRKIARAAKRRLSLHIKLRKPKKGYTRSFK